MHERAVREERRVERRERALAPARVTREVCTGQLLAPRVRSKRDRETPRPHTTGRVYARREGRGVAPVHEDDARARTDAQAIDV